MPPLAAPGEESSDRDPYRQREANQAEQVEEQGERRHRRRPAGDHEPQPSLVKMLDVCQHAVVGDRGEHYRGEGQGYHGECDVPPWCGNQHVLAGRAPAGRLTPDKAHPARTVIGPRWS
jgi:hypothetical protein